LNKLTKGVDPVKMYEYFSQGKPVVATDMAELAQSTDLLYIGKDPDDFARKVDQAIAERDPKLKEQRMEFAAANTWSARVEAIDQAIQKSFPKASILIVTYNCEEYLEPCLDSVLRNTALPQLEVLIVDNNSTDRTRQILKSYAEKDPRVRLQLLDRNTGFAGGNNIAARSATGEYLVFLNPDTIVPPGWLERMVRHCHRDPQIGAVAAVTNFSGNESKINVDYHNIAEMQAFALELAEERAGEVMDINVAALYCVLVPMIVWKAVGGLDDSYEIGMFEDDDFSLRVRRAGYRVVTAEDSFIHHFGNGSFAKLPSEESLRIFAKNKARYETKWDVPWQEHKLRPGARSPFEEMRHRVSDFIRIGAYSEDRQKAPVLRQLHPSFCFARGQFNAQADGQSALVVSCENANPGTVIAFGGVLLNTSYGAQNMLSAFVPRELFEKPGSQRVYLLNSFGESNQLEFVVEPQQHSAAAD
jgi:GT2 family glycosyltransferase